jgi:PAS domain S-box-containing protein
MDQPHFRLDARLEAAPQRFRTFFEQAGSAMVMLAKDGRCLAANDAWEKLFGASRDTLLGYNVFEDAQLKAKGITPYIERALRGESVETPPVYMDPSEIQRAGRACWLKIAYSPVRDEQGDVTEIGVIIREVTEEVEADERLAASVLRFHFLAEAMPQLAWLVGGDGRGEYVNKRWLDYCGITDPVMAQARWADFVHPDDRAASEAGWNRARETGTEFHVEYRLRAHTGEYRWFLARTLPIREAGRSQGPVLAWVGTATDIHEQKEAADAARFWGDVSSALYSSLDYEERLSRVAALAMLKFGGWCVIYARGADGRVSPVAIAHSDSSEVQRAWDSARRLPVSADTEIGIGWVLRHGRTQFIPVVDDNLVRKAARDEEHLALLRRAKISSYMCLPLYGKEGVTGTIMLLSSHRHFTAADLALAEELAGRSGIALENARLFQETTRAVEARDNLLSVTSHELRTPVTSLKLQLQMARRQLALGKAPDPAALQRTFDLSIRQVDRLNTLIEDLLNFSSVNAGKVRYQFVETDVAALVAETIDRHRESSRLSRTPLLQEGPTTLMAEVDPLRFGQVVENLVTNALKYGAGGNVTVSLKEDGERWELSVRDQGMGIPADKLGKIFERYERVGHAEGISGFGLGLFVSRAFVEAHGGTITVESEPGKGSTFRVSLPRRHVASK